MASLAVYARVSPSPACCYQLFRLEEESIYDMGMPVERFPGEFSFLTPLHFSPPPSLACLFS